jgi:hypothetical protein
MAYFSKSSLSDFQSLVGYSLCIADQVLSMQAVCMKSLCALVVNLLKQETMVLATIVSSSLPVRRGLLSLAVPQLDRMLDAIECTSVSVRPAMSLAIETQVAWSDLLIMLPRDTWESRGPGCVANSDSSAATTSSDQESTDFTNSADVCTGQSPST